MPAVDLNADLGEGGRDDAALLDLVTSANVACGGHAGDTTSVRAIVEAAVARGVAVGAHPSYADRPGFGRRRPDGLDPATLPAVLADQLGLVVGACARSGVRLAHVKPHGILYHDAAADLALAVALTGLVADLAPGAALVGPAGSALAEAAGLLSVPFAAEAFADRAYAPDGRLVPRDVPGAVLTDPDEVATRAASMVVHGRVPALGGGWLPVHADTICLHGDTPGALAIARSVRAALAGAGVEVRPLPAARP